MYIKSNIFQKNEYKSLSIIYNPLLSKIQYIVNWRDILIPYKSGAFKVNGVLFPANDCKAKLSLPPATKNTSDRFNTEEKNRNKLLKT